MEFLSFFLSMINLRGPLGGYRGFHGHALNVLNRRQRVFLLKVLFQLILLICGLWQRI